MINISSTNKSFSVNYPEHIDEITAEYFDEVLKGIKVQEHYCIVATCFYDKVFNIVTSLKQKRDTTTRVTCLIAKINDDNECGYKQMEAAVITRTELERAIHLPLSHNHIGVTGFENYVKDDVALTRKLSTGEYFGASKLVLPGAKSTDNANNSPSIYLVEFKIVPIRDIVATKSLTNRGECIFKQANTNGVKAN